MKRQLSAVVAVLGTVGFLTTAMSAYADANTDAKDRAAARAGVQAPVSPPFTNFQVPAGVAVCFTCGGDWPVWAGATHAVTTGSISYERGSGCSGSIAGTNDNNPYICTR